MEGVMIYVFFSCCRITRKSIFFVKKNTFLHPQAAAGVFFFAKNVIFNEKVYFFASSGGRRRSAWKRRTIPRMGNGSPNRCGRLGGGGCSRAIRRRLEEIHESRDKRKGYKKRDLKNVKGYHMIL